MVALSGVAATTGLAACSGTTGSPRSAVADPSHTVPAKPDYTQACSPSGLDSSLPCLQVTLKAIDNARIGEGLGPMALPVGFDRLNLPGQLLVALDLERIDRHLRPFVGLSATLDDGAAQGADRADLPPTPGPDFTASQAEWLGAAANGLDAVYQWVYDDGPGSGVSGCSKGHRSGCWADRHLVLDDPGGRTLVMGAAVNPTADTSSGDRGGPSLAATFAATANPDPVLVLRFSDVVPAGTPPATIAPLTDGPANQSATHIADPPRTEPAVPDFTQSCAPGGLDSTPSCLSAVLAALNHARAAEKVAPMVLPDGFGRLAVTEQLLVAIDLERVDRGLRPFAGLTDVLDGNAQRGADTANDPPTLKGDYTVVDGEWAGGSVNGLDAVYGWMYDDGPGSGNLDCPTATSGGCWGHRHGILDDFGTVGTLVMGAALNPTGDTNAADKGGTSMAVTLAVTPDRPDPFVYAWTPPPSGAAPPPARPSAPGPGGGTSSP